MSIPGIVGVAIEDDYVAMPKRVLLGFRATYFQSDFFLKKLSLPKARKLRFSRNFIKKTIIRLFGGFVK